MILVVLTRLISAQPPLSAIADCKCVFLDVGSNLGVHVRKLYDPNLYERSPYTAVFEDEFDDKCERKNVCSVAFEPNPRHHFRQQLLARHNTKRGRRTWTFPNAVGPPTGWLSFGVGKSEQHEDWAFGLDASGQRVDVFSISLSDFVARFLKPEQHIVMKMDIEGAEHTVLEDMMERHTLERIDTLTIEFHKAKGVKYGLRFWKAYMNSRSQRLLLLDDETNLHDGVPLER